MFVIDLVAVYMKSQLQQREKVFAFPIWLAVQ